MVDKTQRHQNHQAQWTVAEITFVEQHDGQLSAREIGERPGRSANGVARIVQLSGLSGAWRHLGRKRRRYCSGPTIQKVNCRQTGQKRQCGEGGSGPT